MHEKADIGLSARASVLLVSAALLLSGCAEVTDSESASDDHRSAVYELTPLERVAQLRAVDRTVLFADITLRYADTVETFLAEPPRGGDLWQVDIRVPGGTPYELDITWFDTLDGSRLDLVNATRSFEAGFDSGTHQLDFRDYEFDGYDADDDGFTNLAEREANTSPLDANDFPVEISDSGEVDGDPANPANPVDSSAGGNSAFPNGIWRSSTRDTFFADEGERTGPFGGGVMITDTELFIYESHDFEDNAFTPDACYHRSDLVWSVWPRTVVESDLYSVEFRGDFETGMVKEGYFNGVLEDKIYFTYVGPISREGADTFHKTHSNLCDHESH